jgi:hypothetical protein
MPEAVPGSWRGVVNRYNNAPNEVKAYFSDIPELIERYDWEVTLAFMFARVEKALNRMLYCGAAKRHKANSTVAARAVNEHHMTRKEFRRLFENVFGAPIPAELVSILKDAERIRDKVMHGKSASDADKRKAIVRVLAYAEGMNEVVDQCAGFKPFTNDLRGYAGARRPLDESTTYWLMRGLGFEKKSEQDAEAS